jgi:hypothetical protein
MTTREAPRSDATVHSGPGAFGDIHLSVPADESFVRAIRLVTGDAAARAGFGIDVVDDLRLAITELCYAILLPDATTLSVRITVGRSRVSVTGTVDASCTSGPELDAIANVVVDVISDHCSFSRSARSTSFAFEKRGA